jgi:hypothetical protein
MMKPLWNPRRKSPPGMNDEEKQPFLSHLEELREVDNIFSVQDGVFMTVDFFKEKAPFCSPYGLYHKGRSHTP